MKLILLDSPPITAVNVKAAAVVGSGMGPHRMGLGSSFISLDQSEWPNILGKVSPTATPLRSWEDDAVTDDDLSAPSTQSPPPLLQPPHA